MRRSASAPLSYVCNQMNNEDQSLPEGFAPDANGNFMGIPPWAMREANALMSSVTGNRVWDVPLVAKTLSTIFDQRMNEILLNVKQAVEQSVAALNSERTVTHEQLNTPLDAPLRLSANPESAKNLPCPICHGVEGCDHTVTERERAAQTEPLKDKPIDFGDLPHLADRLPLEQVEGFWLESDVVSDIVKLNLYDLIERAKHANYCDVVMRSGGRDIRIQADWIKYMKPARRIPPDVAPLKAPTFTNSTLVKSTLMDAASACQAIANGYVSDVNPERSSTRSQGAQTCARHLMEMANKIETYEDPEARLTAATLAFLGTAKAHEPLNIDWWAERRFRFSEWKAHMREAVKVFLGTNP
jgi:hypothetical protein